MKYFTLINFFWLASASSLTFLSHYFFSRGPDYIGGYSYPLFYFIYGMACWLLLRKKMQSSYLPDLCIFILGSLFLMTGEPLFENDHFRYLWEGKVLLTGGNPYANAPDSEALSHLAFPMKEYVGFGDLSSIYPPISLLWFALGSFLTYEVGLRVLMICNSLLCYYFFKKLDTYKTWHLCLVFPLFQKEFIQAIHIDLVAFSFLFFALSMSSKLRTHLIGVALSVWTKILAIFALPFLLFENNKITVKRLLWLAGIPLSLAAFFYMMMVLLPGDDAFNGAQAFSKYWEWNSGFYSLLKNIIKINPFIARKVTLGCFIIFYFIIFLLFWLKKVHLNLSLLLVYAGLMFFAPVYNGWYSIWFLPFALKEKSLMGTLYSCASSLGYIGWGHSMPTHLRFAELGTHVFFIALLIEQLRVKLKEN